MIEVDAQTAHGMIHDGRPLAPLDLREAGQFGEGHALFAMPLPYSVLERRIADLVPRRSERILLIEDGTDIASRAARRLAAAGYDSLFVLRGGMPAWIRAGHGVYRGVNVPSKLLGELAEQIWHPAMITPAELAEWQASGRAHRLFDARPVSEYAKMRVPGAVCLPNGELPHRAAAMDLEPDAPVVITCAGRTRGIVGAIGLRLAGHDGPIHALENGTQGWHLDDRALERDNTAQPFPPLDPQSAHASGRAADRMIARFGLSRIDARQAGQLLGDGTRTCYLLDVRSAPEAAATPVPGAGHAPAGQLTQATDQWLAVRHARVILVCDTGLRSALAAFWLRQLGYEPHILPLEEAQRLEVGASQRHGAIVPPGVGRIAPRAALRDMAAGARLIDLRASQDYRAGHVAGSVWGIRPRLAGLVSRDPDRPVLLMADHPEDAAFAAQDLVEAGVASVRIIEGGLDDLRKAGAAVETRGGLPADRDCIDYLFFVHDRHDGNSEAARRYLEWETGLIAQMDSDERAQFRLIRP